MSEDTASGKLLLEKTWERIQRKTFTGWVNSHLRKRALLIENIETDLQDGIKLINLLEIISDDTFPFKYEKKANLRIQKVGNVGHCLNFIKSKGVHLAGIGAEEIVDGNLKMILGMIWTIILRFQIQDISLEELSARDALLLWCQKKTHGYEGVNVKNFHFSFQDGLAFCALIHRHRPDLLDYNALDKSNKAACLQTAFDVAEKHLDIPKLLDVGDMLDVPKPDERSVITYVSLYYHVFASSQKAEQAGRRVAKVIDFAEANNAVKNDYLGRAKKLVDWINSTISHLEDRSFDNTLDGVVNKISSFKSYRTNEKPPKVSEKVEIEALLSGLNTKLALNNRPPFHPPSPLSTKDIEGLWERLDKAEHDRSLALREELRKQKKIADLARRFNLLAGKLEAWSSEKQHNLSSSDYGDSISATSAKLKNHDAYESEYASQSERLNKLRGYASELSNLRYEKLDQVNNRLHNLEGSWSNLKNTGDARKQALHQQLERLQRIENLQLDFAKRGLALKTWLEGADEVLTDPIAVETVEGVQELQTAFQSFLSEQQAKTNEYDSVGHLAEECQSNNVPEDKFSEISWAKLQSTWQSILSHVETRRNELDAEHQKQTQHDGLRRSFATAAKSFQEWIQSQSSAVEALSGNAEEQLQKLRSIGHTVNESGPSHFGQVESVNSQLDAANIDDNQYTELTYHGLKQAFESLNVLIKKKEQVLEKEILASKHSGVSPDQLKEFQECFTHFDKDKDNLLDRLELGGCLKSLGEDITFEAGGKLDSILKSLDSDNDGKVTFDEFVGYMIQLSSDSDTPEQLKQAFRTLAGDKDFVTENDLRAVLPADKVAYCLAHMQPYPGVANAFDYNSFSQHLYS